MKFTPYTHLLFGYLASRTTASSFFFVDERAGREPSHASVAFEYYPFELVDSFRAFDSQTRELLSFHRLLVEAESVTGNEFMIGTALATYLKSRHHGIGYTVETQKVSAKRFNILAYPGKNRDAEILVTSHIDTVRCCKSITSKLFWACPALHGLVYYQGNHMMANLCLNRSLHSSPTSSISTVATHHLPSSAAEAPSTPRAASPPKSSQ